MIWAKIVSEKASESEIESGIVQAEFAWETSEGMRMSCGDKDSFQADFLSKQRGELRLGLKTTASKREVRT